MTKRSNKHPGVWVEPKFDPEQKQYPPATGAPDPEDAQILPASDQHADSKDAVAGEMAAMRPTLPGMERDIFAHQVDQGSAPTAGGLSHGKPREYERDVRRPD